MQHLLLAGCLGMLWHVPGVAAPISADSQSIAAEQAVPAWKPLSDSALVLSDPRLETRPDLSLLGSATAGVRAGPQAAYSIPGASAGSTDMLDTGSGLAGAAVREALRGYVNVQRGGTAMEAGAEQPRGPRGELPGPAVLDLGPAAREWIQETVQNILSSNLQLDINDKGQVSFSVLGLGEFSVNVSGDRSEIALISGDTVLLSAQRSPFPGATGSGGGYSGADWPVGGIAGSTGGGNTSTLEGSPLRQAIELVVEVLTHPLSFLVYGLIAAYGLLWVILSRRAALQTARQSAGAAGFAPRTDVPSAAPARTRTRKRRQRARPSTQRA